MGLVIVLRLLAELHHFLVDNLLTKPNSVTFAPQISQELESKVLSTLGKHSFHSCAYLLLLLFHLDLFALSEFLLPLGDYLLDQLTRLHDGYYITSWYARKDSW